MLGLNNLKDRKNKGINLFLIILLLFCSVNISFADEDQPGGTQYDTHPMHWGRFWGRGLFDRNLIWCPVWNIGNLSDSNVSPNAQMRWPGSNGRNYTSYACFYTAAFVTDMSAYEGQVVPLDRDGVQFCILNNGYLPHISEHGQAHLSKNQDHQQMWQPIPGFYNDGAYGWIWGIDEDTNQDGALSPQEDVNYNGLRDVNLDPPESILKSLAISTDKRTWPEYWPGGSYIGDTRPYFDRPPRTTEPGDRVGRWNGEYKSGPISDQETLYRMDDHENDYWNEKVFQDVNVKYWPIKNPDGTPDTRDWYDKERGIAGSGIEVESRSYAWFHPLAEDLLVGIYRVRNYSDYVLDRVVTGMWADPNVGTGDYNDADYKAAEYAPDGSPIGEAGRREFDILYQWNTLPLSEIGGYKIVGTFAFAFLESPGIAYNDDDDDKDGMTNETMDDGIDNDGDWEPYADIGLDRIGPDQPEYKGPDLDGTEGNGAWDTEDANLNGALDKGEDLNKNDKLDMEPVNDDRGTDGVGPDENDWPGPDQNGTECNGYMELGEPDFDITDIDEADQAGLKYVHVASDFSKDFVDQGGYWEKYLSKPDGEISLKITDENIAFNFGARNVKLDPDEWKRFAIALVMGEDQDDAIRNKATMQNIYDNNYRFLTPPLQPTLVSNVSDHEVQLYWDTDAEGSKDPFFGEDFNGYRVYKSTDPKFLDIKTVTDAFGNVLLFEPLAIYDNSDGLTGAHPVAFPNLGVHYDMGKDSGLRHSFRDTLVENGRTYYYAVTSIDAGNDDDFWERGLVSVDYPLRAMPSESPFNITVNVLGNVIYRDRNTAVCIPVEPAAGYREPIVDSLKVEHVSGYAQGGVWRIDVFNKHHVNLGHEYEVTFSDDNWLTKITPDYDWGSTTGSTCINLTTGDTLYNLRYDKAYDFITYGYPELERIVGEGLHFGFKWPVAWKTVDDGHKGIEIIKYNAKGRTTNAWKYWSTETKSNIIMKAIDLAGDATPLPRDFELRVEDHFRADTSYSNAPWIKAVPLNFAIWDITFPENPIKMTLLVSYDMKKTKVPPPPEEMYGQIWDSTRVVIMYPNHAGTMKESWTLRFFKNEFDVNDFVIPPEPGNIFRLRTTRNPTHLDTLRFKVEGGEWSAGMAANDMKNIYVVPDPYVVSNSLETIYELAGSTQRRVDFVNLPPKCTIRIFSASGKLVKKLEHDGAEDFGREPWNLTTDDGPEVAFGMYFYVVEAEGVGTSRGKFAVIK